MMAGTIKLMSSAIIFVMIVTSIPFIGFTLDAQDEKQGVMIDYAYYNVEWIETDFKEGMTGSSILSEVCSEMGYGIEYNEDGTVYSINNVPQLLNVKWGMYVLQGTGVDTHWSQVEDPDTYDVSTEKIIAWARTGTGSEMMPGVDSTGFMYYSYASDGDGNDVSSLKIVTLAPSVTETVIAVGGLEHIIGTDRYSDYPNSLVRLQNSGDIRIVGGYTDPNFELIVAERPDIVFLDGGTGEHVTMADKLRKAGVSCVVLYGATDMDSLLKNLWICASALGSPTVGNSYISDVKEAVNSICRIPEITGKKVFVSLGVSESPYTPGSNTYVTNMLESLGAVNIFADDSEGWFMADKEAVYDEQPEAIIIIYDSGEIKTQRQYRSLISSVNDMWKQTPAFKNGDVFVFSGDAASLISRPGARLPEALELVAKIIDPDSFASADPTDRIGVKYYNDSYNDGDNGYLTYVKAQGLLAWQKD